MEQQYICPMGIHQSFDEPCPRCGATEDSEEGCLGYKEKLERELAKEQDKPVTHNAAVKPRRHDD